MHACHYSNGEVTIYKDEIWAPENVKLLNWIGKFVKFHFAAAFAASFAGRFCFQSDLIKLNAHKRHNSSKHKIRLKAAIK